MIGLFTVAMKPNAERLLGRLHPHNSGWSRAVDSLGNNTPEISVNRSGIGFQLLSGDEDWYQQALRQGTP